MSKRVKNILIVILLALMFSRLPVFYRYFRDLFFNVLFLGLAIFCVIISEYACKNERVLKWVYISLAFFISYVMDIFLLKILIIILTSCFVGKNVFELLKEKINRSF